MKLAMLALLIHPLMILAPTGLFAATDWGIKAESNPGAHGFSQVLYQFTSASANNGSGFEGLGDTWGFNNPEDNPSPPAPESRPLDIVTGLVMLISRFVPIIAPIAFAASLAEKKPTPFTVGTLRTDTITFGCVLLGTILLVGASAVSAGGGARTRCGTLWPDSIRRLGRLNMETKMKEIVTKEKRSDMSSTPIKEMPVLTPPTDELKLVRRHSRKAGLFESELLKTAFRQSLVMLRPDIQWKNPVMFVVEVGTVLTIIYTIAKLLGYQSAASVGYLLALDFWLVATLVIRELRLCNRGSTRQGPGRCLAKDAPRHSGPVGPLGWHHANRRFLPICARETGWKLSQAK